MNADKIAMLLAATVGVDRDRAQAAEKELDSMRKVPLTTVMDHESW